MRGWRAESDHTWSMCDRIAATLTCTAKAALPGWISGQQFQAEAADQWHMARLNADVRVTPVTIWLDPQ